MGMDAFGEFIVPFPLVRLNSADNVECFKRLHGSVKGTFIDKGIEEGIFVKADRMLLVSQEGQNFFSRGSQP